MNETQTREFPIETDKLTKGSRIDASIIEEAFGVVRGTDAYQMALLHARTYISERFRERGEIVTMTQRKHDLVVLTDEEMSPHNANGFVMAIRKAGRKHKLMLGGDRSKMTDATVKSHDRALTVQGAQLSAISKAKREVKLVTHERSTPLLPKKAAKENK